jgi:capsule polysaccharide export protein KpsE/RkpR
MPDSAPKEFHLLDILDFIVKRKEMLITVFLVALVVTYLGVYFFIQDKYEATAVLIPRAEDATSSVGNLLRSVKGVTFGLSGKAPRSDTDLYTTLIYSRSMLDDLVRTFNMCEVYGLDSTDAADREKAVLWLQQDISTEENAQMAYVISVRSETPERAAAMANAIVQKMNARVVALNMTRSKQNREFLSQRIADIRKSLATAEDSLRAYQERTGLFDAKMQVQGILQAHTNLEAELAARRIQRGILEEMYDDESPQVRETQLQIAAYEKKLREMRSQSDPGSPLLALKTLPKTAIEVLRRYREVEINNLILEYITPVHEQAKIEEKKDYPMIQVVDNAVQPAKKSYPPRILFSFIGAFTVTILVFIAMRVRMAMQHTTDPRMKTLLGDAQRWSWGSWKRKP